MSIPRVQNKYTLHAAEAADVLATCPGWNHSWRTVECDASERDIVECSRCGTQESRRCNFDEEYS